MSVAEAEAEIIAALPSTRQVAARFARRFRLDADEAFSTAQWALLRAASRYRSEAGAFAHFACRVVFNALRDEARRARRRARRTVPIGDALGVVALEEAPRSSLADFLALTEGLGEAARSILWDRFVDGLSLEQIGAARGFSKSYAHHLTHAALARIRARLTAT